jgi:hypothetical protein
MWLFIYVHNFILFKLLKNIQFHGFYIQTGIGNGYYSMIPTTNFKPPKHRIWILSHCLSTLDLEFPLHSIPEIIYVHPNKALEKSTSLLPVPTVLDCRTVAGGRAPMVSFHAEGDTSLLLILNLIVVFCFVHGGSRCGVHPTLVACREWWLSCTQTYVFRVFPK